MRGEHSLESFFQGKGDNSFFLWQWVNLAIWADQVFSPLDRSMSIRA
jgi:hypothetical protein